MDDRDELLATVASLYYKLNQSQGQIAARLEVSPSTVSRLIKEARERGIVDIHIHVAIPRDFTLEQELITCFGLKDAYVLQTSPGVEDSTLLSAVGKLATSYLQRVIATLPAGSSVGVAWGASVHAAVSALPDKFSQRIDVVPLLGGCGTLVVDVPDLARMVAAKLGGRHHDLHAPVLVERAALRDMLLTEPTVREGILRARAVKLAITGIGTLEADASSFLRAGLLTRAALAQVRGLGVVGEICGRFFDIWGRYEEFDINQRIIGIELDELRHIPQVLAVARGTFKAPSILGALRGKFFTVLATDDITARAILALAQEHGGG